MPPIALLQERTLVPTEEEAEWAPEPIWLILRTQKSFAPAGIQTSDHPAHSLVTTLILITKANKMHHFSDLFDKVLYMFRTCPLTNIRSISTLHTSNRYLSF
jgi:putative SOS response-associated peptidase YedK